MVPRAKITWRAAELNIVQVVFGGGRKTYGDIRARSPRFKSNGGSQCRYEEERNKGKGRGEHPVLLQLKQEKKTERNATGNGSTEREVKVRNP